MLTFSHPGSRIPDPGVKKHPIPDPGSGSATLLNIPNKSNGLYRYRLMRFDKAMENT
jgi:hypothetical protein